MHRRTFNKLLVSGGAAVLVGSAGAAVYGVRAAKTARANPPPNPQAQLYRDEFRQQKLKVVNGFIVAQSETMDDVKIYEERLRLYEERLRNTKSTQ